MTIHTYNEMIKAVPADLLHLIPGYLERREKDIQYLFDLLRDRDFLAIKEVGHRIKGSGSGYGLDIYSDLGADLERAADCEDKEEVKALIEKLDAATWTFKKCLHLDAA